VLHGSLIVCSLFISFQRRKGPDQLILYFISEPVSVSPPVREPVVQEVKKNIERNVPVAESAARTRDLATDTFPERPDTTSPSTTDSMVLNDPYFRFRRYIGPIDSLPVREGKKRIEFRKHAGDRSKKKKTKSRTAKLDFVPSHLELEVLNQIWESGEITDMEIYAKIDTGLKMTARDLNRALERLEDKGLLSRWIVSPQLIFGFNFLPQDVGIELSAKNRRNRVYRYRSNIDRETVLRYLTAALVRCRMSAAQNADTSAAQRQLAADLFEKAKRVTRKNAAAE
jgi:predicted transcriptional regulator